MGRKTGLFSTALGLAGLGGVVYWLETTEPEAAQGAARPPYVLPVTLATIELGDLEPTAHLTGTVRSPARARLAFRVGGVLESLAVREADAVTAGQVVARLADREARLSLAEADASLGLAERELDKLRAGERDEEKRRLAAERDVVQAEARLAELEVERGRRLSEDDVVSQASLDRLIAEHDAARARAEAAAARLSQALEGTRREDIVIAESRVELARARRDLVEEELAKTRLVAPAGGVVLERFVAPGDYLQAGDPVVEVIDLENLEIEVEIPGRLAAQLDDEPRVVVRCDELPGLRIDTVLTAQIPGADRRSRNFRGLVRLRPEDGGRQALRPGMFARLDVSLRAHHDALVVPSDAVRTTERGLIVVCASSSGAGQGSDQALQATAEWVPVRILASDGDRSVIESTARELAPGERVVVTGVDLAFPGAPLLEREAPDASVEPGSPGSPGSPGDADSAGAAGEETSEVGAAPRR